MSKPSDKDPAAAPPKEASVLSASVLSSEKPGDRIGRYKLLQQIGEGGMGDNWMAGQEEPVRRRVALTVIKPGNENQNRSCYDN